MKIVAVTYGTEGDTRPLAALCRGLQESGDETLLLADAGTLAGVRDLGVPSSALAGDIRSALAPSGAAEPVRTPRGLDATATTLARLAQQNADTWMRQILDAAVGADGLLIAGLATYIGFAAAEKAGIQPIAASLIPLTPTAEFPSPFLPPRPMPRFLNRRSYSLVSGALWRAFRGSTNAARSGVGLPPGHRLSADHPMIYGISPTVLPRPADWPARTWLCGQWVQPVHDWPLPQHVEEFLASGEPPIYVGFGSMAGLDHGDLMDAVVTAVAGRRAVFYPGWGRGAGSLQLPDNFLVIGEAPHDWLFPRMSVIIHHGGSGTTHSAARAGVPSIALPFAADQFFWARRLQQLGIAPAIGGARRVTAGELSAAITAAGSETMRARAADVGARMRTEDGVATAVDRIHRILGHVETTAHRNRSDR
ncbi:glycosyltransferase [Microlunatus sp. Gsoil 973]|uniref:glycosyltransferase n=1 Tax=Microlunatus sp. Gsoil 973 TaxID=2672569 RepID=UPI0012B4997D|nr:glycosyltransferase [Microlunatus sp. Gsoil 973]QGN32662.1 glycosyltransferase [Microlunatus sp. Gsoil 973]